MKLTPFSKTFDGIKVLDFPGMDIKPGTVYAVIGANGSGKSTFAKILAGVVKADRPGPVHDVPRFGYMPQKSCAFRMSVKANLLLNGKDVSRAEHLMEAMQITHLAGKPAHLLSGGETARMSLCRLMMKPYDLVVLDEPTAAMDMEATSLAETMILDYIRESGCALMLVTHSLQQARRIADEVLYFHKGELAESGSREQLLYHPREERTRRFLEFYGI